MDLKLFVDLGIFFRARGRAHAYGELSKRIVFSLFFFALPAILSAAANSKAELFTLLNQESDAKTRISYLARLTAAHIDAKDVAKIEPFLQDSDRGRTSS